MKNNHKSWKKWSFFAVNIVDILNGINKKYKGIYKRKEKDK